MIGGIARSMSYQYFMDSNTKDSICFISLLVNPSIASFSSKGSGVPLKWFMRNTLRHLTKGISKFLYILLACVVGNLSKSSDRDMVSIFRVCSLSYEISTLMLSRDERGYLSRIFWRNFSIYSDFEVKDRLGEGEAVPVPYGNNMLVAIWIVVPI